MVRLTHSVFRLHGFIVNLLRLPSFERHSVGGVLRWRFGRTVEGRKFELHCCSDSTILFIFAVK